MRHGARQAATAGLIAALVAACSVNPVTGERELDLVSESQEIALGREAAANVAQTMELVPNDAVQQYVAKVGKSIAATSERPLGTQVAQRSGGEVAS
jgi:predicted Zn-dependent protease